jgi:hypothetical protein
LIEQLVVIAILIVALGRTRPRLSDEEYRVVRLAGLWIVGTYAMTVFLPIRSSLYAVLPSLGSALAVAAVAASARRASPDRFRRAAIVLLGLLLALVPLYRARNVLWVALADTSTRVLQTLQVAVSRQPAGGRIVLIDDSQERFNLDATFGGLFPDAVALFFGSRWTGELAGAIGAATPSDMTYRFERGQLVPYTARR